MQVLGDTILNPAVTQLSHISITLTYQTEEMTKLTRGGNGVQTQCLDSLSGLIQPAVCEWA